MSQRRQAKPPEIGNAPTLASVFAPPKRKVAPEVSREDKVRQAVKQSCPADEDAIDYLANMAVSLVEDFNDAESLRRELEEGFLPMLEEYEVSTEDARALCAKVVEAAAPVGAADAAEPEPGAVDEEFLCYVPNLLLMYGGSPEPLLRGACLEIRRGHRYGVIGSNGSGKTTLMARIASKDISGLPEDLRVVLLRHEAILQGVRRSTKVCDYVSQRNVGEDAASAEEMEKALHIMGFETEDQMGKAVLELSGGWQMRLALACAVARKANLLLLDEPTNHLDAEGVRWLVDFINSTCGDGQGAAMIVSHDPDFLDLVCTDVVHFSPSSQKGKLAYYPGIFSAFKANQLKGDEAEAKRLLETEQKEPSLGLGPDDGNRMAFPIPEKIGDTTAERKAAVVTLEKAAFQYKGAAEPVFQDISVELSMSSRVGIVGKNGSGKSTLLSMLAGRKQPTTLAGKTGRLWWHKDLRLAYIAQHALVHLGNYVDKTPLEYMQIRFRRGFDEETPIVRGEKLLSAKEEEEMQKVGLRHGKRGKAVEALINRIEITDKTEKTKEKDREFLYEVKWKDLSPAENTFESVSRLKQLKALKLVEDLNARIWAAWAGCPQRPLTDREVLQHMDPFGLDEDVLCHRRISMLSSGQKCKLALGAAFWTRPHVICLDEPTNYLDTDTVELLKRAMRAFRGGFAVVSHSEKLIEEVCDEVWTMEDGCVTAERRARRK